MTRQKKQDSLRGCILAALLIVPVIAGEGGSIPAQAKQFFAEPGQTARPPAWRRVRFGGGGCDKCDTPGAGEGRIAPVTVYSDFNGEGKTQGFGLGRYRASKGELNGVGNDSISSLSVEPGYTVQLCQSEGNGDGADCLDFEAGRRNVPNEFDNRASFIRVRRK
jgi:hypothetical protein